jgi:antitoxin HicB
MFDYPVILEPQAEGGFVVTFPDVPEAVTQGEDREEALLYAVDALETALSFYVDSRLPLPVASKAKRGQAVVHPSALESAKLAIYSEMVEQGLRKSDLARRLGWHLPQVDRLLDLKHATRMEHLESAARILGKEIRLSVV